MTSFSDSKVWGFLNVLLVLFACLLLANLLKKSVKFLRRSLIPTSVIGGLFALLAAIIYEAVTGQENLFDTAFFGGNGSAVLEMLTYHGLALGFIASTLRPATQKFTKQRNIEIFNTGVTTVATYLMQGVLGLVITIAATLILPDFFSGAGVLLPFGYGQGTGQAMNYGGIFETQYGFVGGKSFGLTIAALGFISAGIGGVSYLNVLRKKGRITFSEEDVTDAINGEAIQNPDEVPMNGSIDKMTIQLAIITVTYGLAFFAMRLLGGLLGENLKATIFGLNFLFGVLFAAVVKGLLGALERKQIVHKKYINPFLMTRLSNFFFDLMIIAGVAAIRLEVIKKYWWILLLLGALGAAATYGYNLFIAKKLFRGYADEQFLVMYGMLTGTASTGIILLREKDMKFQTPAADNLVYQNFPAIALGFPMMILATLAAEKPLLTLGITAAYWAVLNVLHFRSFLFKRKKNTEKTDGSEPTKTE